MKILIPAGENCVVADLDGDFYNLIKNQIEILQANEAAYSTQFTLSRFVPFKVVATPFEVEEPTILEDGIILDDPEYKMSYFFCSVFKNDSFIFSFSTENGEEFEAQSIELSTLFDLLGLKVVTVQVEQTYYQTVEVIAGHEDDAEEIARMMPFNLKEANYLDESVATDIINF